MGNWSLGRRVWTTYVAVLLGTALVYVGLYKGWWAILGLPETVVNQLTSTLLAFLFVGFFANLLLIRSVQSGIVETVRETLPQIFTEDENSVFYKLGAEARATIVQQALRAQLGSDYGKVIYSNIVEGYLQGEQYYRQNQKYQIRCAETMGPMTAVDTTVRDLDGALRGAADKYLWVTQLFECTRSGFRDPNEPLETLKVNFVFSIRQLEAAVHDTSIFFREILHIENSVRQRVLALRDEQLEGFIKDVLKFRAYAMDGSPIGFRAYFAYPSAEQIIELEIQNPSRRAQGSGCKIEFCLPQARSEKYFVVTIPRPTENGAEVIFEKSETMHDLSDILFLSDMQAGAYEINRTASGASIGPESIRLKTNNWMFPTSGIVFFWK